MRQYDGNVYLDIMALLFLSTNGEQLITLLLACFPRGHCLWYKKNNSQFLSHYSVSRKIIKMSGRGKGGKGGPDNLRASEPYEACEPCEACEPSENRNF